MPFPHNIMTYHADGTRLDLLWLPQESQALMVGLLPDYRPGLGMTLGHSGWLVMAAALRALVGGDETFHKISRDGDRLVLRRSNAGDPYRDGVDISIEGDDSLEIFLEDAEIIRIADFINAGPPL